MQNREGILDLLQSPEPANVMMGVTAWFTILKEKANTMAPVLGEIFFKQLKEEVPETTWRGSTFTIGVYGVHIYEIVFTESDVSTYTYSHYIVCLNESINQHEPEEFDLYLTENGQYFYPFFERIINQYAKASNLI